MRYWFWLVAFSLLCCGQIAWAAPGDVFYFEDFSLVKEGDLPSTWSGGQNSMVKEDRGRKLLVLFQHKQDSFVIPDVLLPENWNFDIVVKLDWEVGFTIGAARVLVNGYTGETQLNSTGRYGETLNGKTVTISLRKEGAVYKVSINGREVVMGRFPGPVTGNSLSLSIAQCNLVGQGGGIVAIYSVKGTEL